METNYFNMWYFIVALMIFLIFFQEKPKDVDPLIGLIISVGIALVWPAVLLGTIGLVVYEKIKNS